MKTLIKNAKIIFENEIKNGEIAICDSKISEIGEQIPGSFDNEIDAGGNYVSPGFIDMHVHGGGGIEFLTAAPDDIIHGAKCHAKYGTTTIVPTLSAAPLEIMKKGILNIRAASEKYEPIAGVFLEGPFLSPKQCGAQVPGSIITPSPKIYEPLLNLWDKILAVGVAPELPGALELGDYLRKKGILATIAHSDATFDEVEKAIFHGFSDVTHIYSCCSTVIRKNAFRVAGVVEAGLYFDELSVQVIADLKHLPVSLLKLIYKCKGSDKISLITDGLSFSASELKDGTIYTQGTGNDVLYEDGVMKLTDRSAFAGSVATTSDLVRNMYKTVGVPLFDAVKMSTKTPAEKLSLGSKKGALKPGFDADILIFDDDINIEKTIIMGKAIL